MGYKNRAYKSIDNLLCNLAKTPRKKRQGNRNRIITNLEEVKSPTWIRWEQGVMECELKFVSLTDIKQLGREQCTDYPGRLIQCNRHLLVELSCHPVTERTICFLNQHNHWKVLLQPAKYLGSSKNTTLPLRKCYPHLASAIKIGVCWTVVTLLMLSPELWARYGFWLLSWYFLTSTNLNKLVKM